MKTDTSSPVATPTTPGSSSLPVKPKTNFNQQDFLALHIEATQIAATWSGTPATEGKGLDAVVISGKYEAMPGEDPGRGTLSALLTNQTLGFKTKQPEIMQHVLARMSALHPELTLKYCVQPDRRAPQRAQYDYTVTSATKVFAESELYLGEHRFWSEDTVLGWVFSFSDLPGYYLSDGRQRTPHKVRSRMFATIAEASTYRRHCYRSFLTDKVSVVVSLVQ